ncbi:MAG: AAA family ATPase [SAR202 cluster bacterium]|nr:AAA family ATPase [SAR202 cluster bacterium]
MTTHLLEGLNSAQREAVETIDGPLLIVAGPGSGKTRVITHRIAYLLREVRVSPYRILAVTFTNKAAREMQSRLDRLVGQRSKDLTVGTFHAFCALTLRKYGQHVGLDPGFSIFDDEDQQDLLKIAMEDAEVDPKKFNRRAVHSAISRAKSLLMDSKAMALRKSNYFEEIAARIYARYEELLTSNNAVDFDDLLLKTVHLLRNVAEVRERYQDRYVHMMIDEFQDTNICQYELAKIIVAKHRNICVVGDPDQSIYSWRNADIRNILSFKHDFPNARVVNLEENYRSTSNILEAAKGVIAANRQRLNNNIRTSKPGGSKIAIHEAFNEEDEAKFVLQQIDGLVRKNGVKLGDFAVMYRVNAQSRALEEACLRYGIKYRLVGGVRFYQRREVKDIIAYLRLINNPHDQVSILRVINVPTRGLGQKSLEQLEYWARTRNLSLYGAMEHIYLERTTGAAPTHPLQPRMAQSVVSFVALIEELRKESQQRDLVSLLDLLLERIAYKTYLEKDLEDAEERWDNIIELRNAAQDFKGLPPPTGLTSLLEHLALVSDVDNYEDAADSITLITLHQAKGLEFPVVFITGLEEGLLPHMRSMDSPEEIEEERRLFYVGITRAMERLFFTRAFRRGLAGGAGGPSIPSRFLQEVPQHLFTTPARLEPVGRASAPPLRMHTPPQPDKEEKPALVLRAGDKVKHSIFGEGVVVGLKGQGGDQEATVVFKNDIGMKRLLLSYAPLEKLSA